MRASHEQAVAADARLLALARRTVDARILADRRAVADDRIAFLALELQVLRLRADRGELKDMTVLADARPAVDDGMRLYARSRADGDVCGNDGVRADLDIFAKRHMIFNHSIRADLHTLFHMRARTHDRRFVDICHHFAVYHFSHPLFHSKRALTGFPMNVFFMNKAPYCYNPANPVDLCLSYFGKIGNFRA